MQELGLTEDSGFRNMKHWIAKCFSLNISWLFYIVGTLAVFRLIYNLIILLAIVPSLLGCMEEHVTRAKEENYFLTFTILLN